MVRENFEFLHDRYPHQTPPAAMSDDDVYLPSGGATSSDSEDDAAVVHEDGRDDDVGSGDSEADEPDGGAGGFAVAPADDHGFVRGWHRPVNDHGPPRGLSELLAEQQSPRKRGPLKRSKYMSPLPLFKLWWTDDLLDEILVATNSTPGPRGSAPMHLTKPELLRWIALTLLFGINVQPTVRDYWATSKFGLWRLTSSFVLVTRSSAV